MIFFLQIFDAMSLNEENKIKTEPSLRVDLDPSTLCPENVTNPWLVDSLQDFLFLKCPECTFDTKEEDYFQEHATEKHPLSIVFFAESKVYKEEQLDDTILEQGLK